MPDYNAIVVKIKDGLLRGGTTMTLRRTAKGTYDPALGTFAADTLTDYTAVGLFPSGTMPQSGMAGQRFFNGILVQTDDQEALLSAICSDGTSLPAPRPGDLLIYGSDTFTVVTQIPVMPGGIPLMYRILARK